MIDKHEMAVLVVDDIITMCKSIHNMIRVLGYGRNVFYANDGREALRVLEKESIDLILMDFNMPGMTGGETLSSIRENRSLKHIPVIMVTAEAYKEFVAEAAESEADAYILKPLTIKLLDDKISSVIDKTNNPPPMILHLKKAMGHEDDGDIDAAIEEAKLAMDADPKSSRPVRELGYYYLKRDDLVEAEKWLLKAADMNHMDVFAFHHLGALYLEENNMEMAQKYFEKAMDISPRHVSRGLHFGRILIQRNMVKRAITVFNKVFSLARNTVEMKEDTADFCIEHEVYEYAAVLLESLIRKQPDREDLLFQMGKSMEKLDEAKKALTYLVRAEKIDKEDICIKIHLARNYLTIEKPILAEKALKKILKIDPDHEEAKELYRQCAYLN